MSKTKTTSDNIELSYELRVELFDQLKKLPYEKVANFIQAFQKDSITIDELNITIQCLKNLIPYINEKIAFNYYLALLENYK